MEENNLLPITMAQALIDAQGQLMPRSRRIYANDTKVFASWLLSQELTPEQIQRSDMIRYRAYLTQRYKSSATRSRMLSVARRILDEQVISGRINANPLKGVKGFKVDNETQHVALTKKQARQFIESIDTSHLVGKRDYAMILLLIRTGIRRSECSALNIEDIREEQGHTIIMVQHGKGDKRRIVKLPVDVLRYIKNYLEAASRLNDSPDSALFYGCDRWKRSTRERISDKLIERAVKTYAEAIGIIGLTPHGLRATFITLALEGGASLTKVQYAAGHADPRTTERYQKRKTNLDDNAVDYVKF